MHDVRERPFQCEFESASRHWVAHVRAWDAQEALQLFIAELRAEGIDEAGDVTVSPARAGGEGAEARLRRHFAA